MSYHLFVSADSARSIEQFRYLVLAAQREGNRRLAATLAPLGLTPSQSEVLRVLADHGPLSLTALGELLVCESGNNPSRLAGRLVDAGLVRRAAVSGDARQVQLSLTASGRERAAAARRADDDLHEYLRARLRGADVSAVVAALAAVVHDTPAGQALTKRNPEPQGTQPS